MPNVIRKTYDLPDFLKAYVKIHHKVLNLGSSSATPRPGWTHFDIEPKPGVDEVGDAHDLSRFKPETFDIVICCAMLQHCRSPHIVAREIFHVLKKDGLVYIDVPFVQPYCSDGPDRNRFTKVSLRETFSSLTEIGFGVTIPASSALLFHLSEIPGHPYIRTALQFALWPFKWVVYGNRPEVAGGLYLIGRKG